MRLKHLIVMDMQNKKIIQVVNTKELVEKTINKYHLQNKILNIRDSFCDLYIMWDLPKVKYDEIPQKGYQVIFTYDKDSKHIVVETREIESAIQLAQ